MKTSTVVIIIGLVLIVAGIVPIYFGTQRQGYHRDAHLLERSLFYDGISVCGIGFILIATGLILLSYQPDKAIHH